MVLGVSICRYGLLNPEPWDIPPGYSREGLMVLTLLQAAARGDFQPMQSLHLSNLGAPMVANWDAWPIYNPLAWKVGGWLCHVFGLAPGAHLFLLAAHAGLALLMYLSLRWMRVAPLWAMVSAVTLGLCPLLFRRGFTPMGLANVSAVPLVILAGHAFLANRERVTRWPALVPWAALSFFMGGVAPLYSWLYLALIGLACLQGWMKARSLSGLWPMLACVAAFLSGFVVQLRPVLVHAWQHGWRLLSLDDRGFPVATVAHPAGPDAMATYLGVPGWIAVTFVLASSLHGWWIKQERPTAWCWSVLALYGVALVGGNKSFCSVMIFAVAMSYVAVALSRHAAGWRQAAAVAIALLILGTAVTGPLRSRKQFQPESNAYRKSHSDAAFAAKLEKILPPGSLVYCFPSLGFPNGAKFLRPALWGTAIRYDFGHLPGQDPKDWPVDLARRPAGEIIGWLEQKGFQGVLLYKKENVIGELKEESERFRREVKPLGLAKISDGHGDFMLYRIPVPEQP